MGLEIERKYLVRNRSYRDVAEHRFDIRQGFLSDDTQRVVRVRIQDGKATLSIKGPVAGRARLEFEYPLPADEAAEMIGKICLSPTLQKTRYIVRHGQFVWEVDEFAGENDGLVIAEVELPDPDLEPEIPSWVGDEVTHDARYYNANLVKNPYSRWKNDPSSTG